MLVKFLSGHSWFTLHGGWREARSSWLLRLCELAFSSMWLPKRMGGDFTTVVGSISEQGDSRNVEPCVSRQWQVSSFYYVGFRGCAWFQNISRSVAPLKRFMKIKKKESC